MITDPCNDPMTYAPVLQRMVEILGSSNERGTTFGAALEQASKEKGIPVPKHMYGPLLVSAFKVIATGKIPGCPDA